MGEEVKAMRNFSEDCLSIPICLPPHKIIETEDMRTKTQKASKRTSKQANKHTSIYATREQTQASKGTKKHRNKETKNKDTKKQINK